MNNTENIARILVEVEAPDAEGKAGIGITLDGSLNDLLNGIAALSADILDRMIQDEGKELAMQVYAAVQMDVMNRVGIDPAEEMRANALRTLATIASVFADEDPEEEAEAE